MMIKTEKTQAALILQAAVCLAVFLFGGCMTSDKQVFAEKPGQTASNEIEMVWIQPGTFLMGSPEDEPGHYFDETQHEVTLTKGFYLGKFLVTQEQYQAVIGTNPSYFKGKNLPVETVNWYDAIIFCNRLSMKEGLSSAYRIKGSTDPADWGAVPDWSDDIWNAVEIVPGSSGYRLPTEAQWEYACRAGTVTAYNTGKKITPKQANYDTDIGKTSPVGSYAPNAWGLYDMHGNVREWCWDLYGEYSDKPQTDPLGASTGWQRVVRGGRWLIYEGKLRSAIRIIETPIFQSPAVGIRLLRP